MPLAVHARYTRTEILAAFDVGSGVKPITWQSGVWWDEKSQSDLFAFTLDKSAGSFSPTTRYRDYAISPELIHWESQSATSLDSDAGRRYIRQAEQKNERRALRPPEYSRSSILVPRSCDLRHARTQRERPIAITWRLDHRLSGDLFAEFAAAVA